MKRNGAICVGFLPAALGMLYAALAVSPLYVFKLIAAESGGAQPPGEAAVLGPLSLILWSLLLPGGVKNVLLLLRADNRGEGGVFALYTLARERGHGRLLPAALGAAALLGTAALLPALTLTAAAEAGRSLLPESFDSLGPYGNTVFVILALTLLFFFQGNGSRRLGRVLGPLVLVWLLFIGAAGAVRLAGGVSALRALDPRLGLRFLFRGGHPAGFGLLGFVFLSVTGTELLYANLDLTGRKAIVSAWPFVLLCLALSYLGQGAWLLKQLGEGARMPGAADPFFRMLPSALRLPALLLALASALAASQTVINGAFSLASEAIRLDLLPAWEIRWPSASMRQEYIPALSFLLWLFGCAAAAGFQSAQRMAPVCGASAAISMLSVSALLFAYLRTREPGLRALRWLPLLFGAAEAACLFACLVKLTTGGVLSLLLLALTAAVMLLWKRGGAVARRFSSRLALRRFLPQLAELRACTDLIRHADNLVYFDDGDGMETVDRAILYSVLDEGPKRARAYFFVTVNTVGEPYLQDYRVESFGTDWLFRLRLDLGYKCSRPPTVYLRAVFLDMKRQGLLPSVGRKNALGGRDGLGSFRFCILKRRACAEDCLSLTELWALRLRSFLQDLAGERDEWYADEDTDFEVERVPLRADADAPRRRMQRVFDDTEAPD